MPLIICILIRQETELICQARDYSPTFLCKLQLVHQGALAHGYPEPFNMDNLEDFTAAEKTRSSKGKSQNQRQGKKGGVRYASEAGQ